MDDLIVVDDGSGISSEAVLGSIEASGVSLVRLPSNRGIAVALNVGTRAALGRGAEFVVHSDQDTFFPPDYVSSALGVFRAASPVTRLGLVVAERINGAPALPTAFSPEGFALVPEAIQTGFVLHANCIAEVGDLDERLVIDCVDIEFCLRVTDAGFTIALAPGTDVQHSIGRREPVRVLGREAWRGGVPITYEYHSPERRYYITRNNLDLVLRYARRRPLWCLRVLKRGISTAVLSVTSGPRSSRQLLAIVVGTVDGLRRRRGPISRGLARVLA